MAKVTVNRPSIYPFGGLILMPGDNEVSEKDLKMLTDQKGVMRDVDRGILTIDKPKRGRPPKAREEPEQEQPELTEE